MTIRILLADDHAIFRSGLRALLEKEADMTVVGETGSGHETLTTLGRAQCTAVYGLLQQNTRAIFETGPVMSNGCWQFLSWSTAVQREKG